jgi:L-threonine-O-3-phosphate decarboxylase
VRPVHGGNLDWAALLADCSPSVILDFSASINPLGPPVSAIAAIQAHLGNLRDYPDPECQTLRLALGQFHNLSPDWILPGNGSAELLTWASRELSELVATYLITPAFGDYRRALHAFDAKVIDCPLDLCPFDLESGDRSSEISLSSLIPDLIPNCGLLLNNPHNPTGQLFSISAILPYLDRFALVVLDEAFMDFLPPDQQQSLIDQVPMYPNLVILRSLTKFYSLAGLRLGYAIAHPDRLRRWQQWRDPWSVNVLAAAAGAAVIQDIAFQRQTWDWLATAKVQLYQGLTELPGLLPYPGAANFLLVQSQRSAVDLQQQLLRQDRILIRDCVSFPELGDRYFRVAVRTQTENQRLLAGLTAAISSPDNQNGEIDSVS